MTAELLYLKKGRRYKPVSAQAWHNSYEVMDIGTFKLVQATENGTRTVYGVEPDTAGFIAASMIARKAMEQAIAEAATSSPQKPLVPWTASQVATIEEFKKRMGGMFPVWWESKSAHDIVSAGIQAVIDFQEKKNEPR